MVTPPSNPTPQPGPTGPGPVAAVLKPGDRVRVTQQVQHKRWSSVIEGVVVAVEQRKTGSWFAHSKDDKLWLDRLELRKDDGEIIICNLDRYSHIDILQGGSPDDPAAASDRVPTRPVEPRHAGGTADQLPGVKP